MDMEDASSISYAWHTHGQVDHPGFWVAAIFLAIAAPWQAANMQTERSSAGVCDPSIVVVGPALEDSAVQAVKPSAGLMLYGTFTMLRIISVMMNALNLFVMLSCACRSETSAGGYLELLQEQEEEVLQRALHKLSGQEAALYQRSGRK